MSGELRNAMPHVTAFIDAMRREFGKLDIDQQIKAGMRGAPTFYAEEGGHTIGTKPPYDPERAVKGSELVTSEGRRVSR